MRRCLVLIMAIAACGGGGSGGPVDPPQQQFGTVRGRVLATGDTALQNVAINLTHANFASRSAATDASGNFQVANVETGAWTVAATAPTGYEADGQLTASATVVANQFVDVPVFRMRRVAAPPPPPPPPNISEVEILDNSFSPATVTIAAGGTVRWINYGTVAHNSTRVGTWASPNLNPGQQFDRVFTTAGTFTYSCTLHAGMNGTVIVQ